MLEEDWGRSKWLKITKNNFLRFWLFTPLFRRFRLPRVSQTTDLDEIYRLVSKILHFMPCGSVLENQSKIYRKSIEIVSKIYRKSIEIVSKIYRKSIENLSKIYREYIEIVSKIDRKSSALGSICWRLWRSVASVPLPNSTARPVSSTRQTIICPSIIMYSRVP